MAKGLKQTAGIMRDLITADLDPGASYQLVNAIIAPRPIAWISTISTSGVLNLAPHSYTTVASTNPLMVSFTSIGRKDTLTNIEATGEFVYNVGGRTLVEQINRTSADFPPDEDEFIWAGVTPEPSSFIAPPRVREAPVQLECRLWQAIQIRDTDNYLVIGEVLVMHLAEELFEDDRLQTEKLAPIGRLAGSRYAQMGEIFSLDRPTWSGLRAAGIGPMDGYVAD